MIEDKDIQEKDLDNICEECKNEDESVSHNLILTGFKVCNSCKISKTIFFSLFSKKKLIIGLVRFLE